MIYKTDLCLVGEGKIYVPKNEWEKFKKHFYKEIKTVESVFVAALNGTISELKCRNSKMRQEFLRGRDGIRYFIDNLKTTMCYVPSTIHTIAHELDWLLFGYTRYISTVRHKDVTVITKNGAAFGPWRVTLDDNYCCVTVKLTEAESLINCHGLELRLKPPQSDGPAYKHMFFKSMFDRVILALEKVNYYGETGGIIKLYDYMGTGFDKTLKIGSGENSKPYFGSNSRKVKSEGNVLV